jgi:hypothetical protein
VTSNIQLSVKEPNGIIWVIGGSNSQEFEANLHGLLGPDLGQKLLNRAFDVFDGLTNDAPVPTPPAHDGPSWAQPEHAHPQPRQWGQQPSAAPSSPSQGEVVQDNFGNAWTYNLAGAPSCKHGPMPQKRGRSKAGKPYTGWFCPAGGPQWRGDRSDKCPAVFND